MRQSDRLQARQRGELAAARELSRLRVDLTQAVDVFRIIKRQQLWLVFQPIDSTLGVYLRGGILINSKRRLSIQRLTAAHEYGHHLLQHEVSVDGEENIGDPQSMTEVKEIEAQAFATDFLMPLRLVNGLWNRFGLPDRINPFHAYLLSLYMGTSYQATVYQLIAQERLSVAEGQGFLKVQPKQIKQSIGRGIGPQNSWAETWPVGREQSGSTIQVAIGDEINIELPESPSTGYLWSIVQEGIKGQNSILSDVESAIEVKSPIGFVRSEFDAIDRRFISAGTGGTGSRYITLRALKEGRTEIQILLGRSWLVETPPLDKFTLGVLVLERLNGLPHDIQEALVAA